ncbi:hypothetical protein GCM10023157_12370 [Gluconacetobacter asukensis]
MVAEVRWISLAVMICTGLALELFEVCSIEPVTTTDSGADGSGIGAATRRATCACLSRAAGAGADAGVAGAAVAATVGLAERFAPWCAAVRCWAAWGWVPTAVSAPAAGARAIAPARAGSGRSHFLSNDGGMVQANP